MRKRRDRRAYFRARYLKEREERLAEASQGRVGRQMAADEVLSAAIDVCNSEKLASLVSGWAKGRALLERLDCAVANHPDVKTPPE